MSNRASENKALPEGEDKSLKPSEDKAEVAVEAEVPALTGEVLPAPTTITVELLHHCPEGLPGDQIALPADKANQLIVNARAKLA